MAETKGDPRTTTGNLISGFGTLVASGGVFFPPLFIIGAVISAGGKIYSGLHTPDKESVVKLTQ